MPTESNRVNQPQLTATIRLGKIRCRQEAVRRGKERTQGRVLPLPSRGLKDKCFLLSRASPHHQNLLSNIRRYELEDTQVFRKCNSTKVTFSISKSCANSCSKYPVKALQPIQKGIKEFFYFAAFFFFSVFYLT